MRKLEGPSERKESRIQTPDCPDGAAHRGVREEDVRRDLGGGWSLSVEGRRGWLAHRLQLGLGVGGGGRGSGTRDLALG